MNRLVVSLDLPTAVEARRAARSLSPTGVAVRLGPRLLNRVGPSVIAAIRQDTPVFADARMSGSVGEVVAAVRSLAAVGARWISVDGQMGAAAIKGAADGAAAYGASVLVVTVAPEAVDPGGGRGRAVSAISRSLAESGAVGFLGLMSDIGVVAQTAPSIPVLVFDADTPEAVSDALHRGAGAAVVDAGIARSSDPARAAEVFVEAARAG